MQRWYGGSDVERAGVVVVEVERPPPQSGHHWGAILERSEVTNQDRKEVIKRKTKECRLVVVQSSFDRRFVVACLSLCRHLIVVYSLFCHCLIVSESSPSRCLIVVSSSFNIGLVVVWVSLCCLAFVF